MNAIFSEEYYRKYWDEFLKPVPGDDFIDLEGTLKRTMERYIKNGMPSKAVPYVEKMEAEKLIKACTDLVRKEKAVVEEVEAGKASFGMMTYSQETQARARYRKRFEFNCLQLRDFKEKYGA